MHESVPYKLDKERKIKLNMSAIDRFEVATGKPFMELEMIKVPVAIMIALVWSGMSVEDPELTIEKTKELIDLYSNVAELYQKSVEAVLTTLPDAKPEKEFKPGDAERINKSGKNVKRA